jgi:ankyrin repeat protein
VRALVTDTTNGTVAWDRPSKYGTALHMAAYLGQVALVQALLASGADVNARNDEGDTPLHKAALTGRVQVVELLLQQPDVDLAAENNEAQTAATLARNRDVVALLRCTSVSVSALRARAQLAHRGLPLSQRRW